jgi:RNA polymerase sigma-B factor
VTRQDITATREDVTDSRLSLLHRRPPVQRYLPSDQAPNGQESEGHTDAGYTGSDPGQVDQQRPTPAGDRAGTSSSARVSGERTGQGRHITITMLETVDALAAGRGGVDLQAVDVQAVDVQTVDLESDLERVDLKSTDLDTDLEAVDPEVNDLEETAPKVDPRLVALSGMKSSDPRHGVLRRVVIEAHLPLVHHLAQRFRGRGEPYDDLVQVGTIGLLHAVDRYDPARGSFAAFAVPTIVGEIRRHFRDRGWALRIPRRVQDLGRRVSEARETLTHGLDRSPTVHEIAAYLQVDPDLVLEALETASAYITVPLPITADESDRMTKAFEDSGLELVEQRETLRPLLARLPARQQRILELRFARGMSQSQIASEVGVSQMHVSRLLTKSLSALRSGLTQEL